VIDQHTPLGLFERVDLERPSVDFDTLVRPHTVAQRSQLSIDFNATGGDPLLHLSARTYSGARQHFLQLLAHFFSSSAPAFGAGGNSSGNFKSSSRCRSSTSRSAARLGSSSRLLRLK